MGPLRLALKMMPGVGSQLGNLNVDERTSTGCRPSSARDARGAPNPTILNGSRRRRIALGSETNVQAVKQLVKQFGQMKKMMRQLSRRKMPSLRRWPASDECATGAACTLNS